MKIFEFRWTSQDEKEWVSGRTIVEALKTYKSVTGTDIEEMEDDDDIVEIPREKWGEYTVNEVDNDRIITFEQWMEENKSSDIIAGTMYY